MVSFKSSHVAHAAFTGILLLTIGGVGQHCSAAAECPFSVLLADDASVSDMIGNAVAVSGDTVVVGAPNAHDVGDENFGAAYVYTRTGDGWMQQAKLIASDPAAASSFGQAVDIDGDVIVVGSQTTSFGAVYVFERTDDLWIQTAILTPDPLLAGTSNHFGISVAIDGPTIVVGHYTDKQTLNRVTVDGTGSAYVFTNADGPWETSVSSIKLGALGQIYNYQFGISVDVEGDRIVVGARGTSGTFTKAGSAYIYEKGGGWATTTSPNATLNASDQAITDLFGRVVALSGDTVLVGAPFDDNEKGTDKGAAYVFVESRGVWTQQQKLLSINSDVTAFEFASSVSLVGDTAIISEPWQSTLDPNFLQIIKGTAQVFTRSDSVWTGNFEYAPFDPETITDPEGILSLAFDGSTLVVGSPSFDGNGLIDRGAAFVMTGLDQDCDADGLPDCCDIYSGDSLDIDNDGVPDECVATVPGDLTGDGLVDGADLGLLLAAWGTDDDAADLNEDGIVDGADLGLLLSLWSA
jgi:hypothetical protein